MWKGMYITIPPHRLYMSSSSSSLFSLATTRFTDHTYQQNKHYRTVHCLPAIYGSMRPLSSKCRLFSLVCVIEMNNTCNRIEGVAWFVNRNRRGMHTIYARCEHNLHIYVGFHWVSRDQLSEWNADWLSQCETRLFTGLRHMKRPQGITLVSADAEQLLSPGLHAYFEEYVSPLYSAHRPCNNNKKHLSL